MMFGWTIPLSTLKHWKAKDSVASLTLTLQDNYGHMNMCHHAIWKSIILTKHYFSIILTYPSPRNNKTSVFLLDTLHRDRTSIHVCNDPTGGLNTLWYASCLVLSFPYSSTSHNELWQLVSFISFHAHLYTRASHNVINPAFPMHTFKRITRC